MSDEESTGRFEAGMCPEERGGTHGGGIGRDCGMRRFEVKIGYDHRTVFMRKCMAAVCRLL